VRLRTLAKMAADGELGAWLDSTNAEYEKLHLAFENDFWSTKMALKGASTDSLTATKSALDKFLRDKDNLATARTWQSSGKGSDDQKVSVLVELAPWTSLQIHSL
jgi:hypothetical protein